MRIFLMNKPQPTSSKTQRSRTPVLLALLALLLLAGGGIALNDVWQKANLHELYLPELKQRAKNETTNGHLLALLAIRYAEAAQYGLAAEAFEKAFTAGERHTALWLSWAASTAADGQVEKAFILLQTASKEPDLAPAAKVALDRCNALPPNSTPEQLASAICPEGLEPLVKRYTAPTLFSDWIAGQGRSKPETSGFATREKWAKTEPDNMVAQRLWGEALTRNLRFIEGEKQLRPLLTKTSNSPEVHAALGEALLGQGAPAKAGLEFNAALKKRPDWVPALLGLGRVALEKKLIGMGMTIHEKLVKLEPNNPDAWIGLGVAYYNQRLDLSRSLEGFDTAKRLAPTRTDFNADYSKALRANFRNPDAETVLRQRLAEEPNDSQCLYLLALVLLEYKPDNQRRDEAEKALRASLEHGFSSAAADRLGRILLAKGDAQEAASLLERSLAEDIYNIAATSALVRAYRQLNREADAKKLEASLVDLSKYIHEVRELEDLLRRAPLDAKLHKRLANLMLRGGETKKAQFHIDAARMLETNRKQAAAGLSNLIESTTDTTPLKERPRQP